MKKLLHFSYVLAILVVLLIWISGAGYILQLSPKIESYATAFVIAPLSETLFYLYLPMLLADKINERFKFDLEVPIMLFVAFQFILLHEFNYETDGRYLACVFQGAMFMSCWLIIHDYWKQGGYWYSALLHSLYNLSIFFILKQIL